MELFIDIFIISLQKREKKKTFQSRIPFHSLIDFVDSFPFITDKKREEDEKSCSHTHNGRERVRIHWHSFARISIPFDLLFCTTNEWIRNIFSSWRYFYLKNDFDASLYFFLLLSVNSVQSSIEAWHFSAFQSVACLPLLSSNLYRFSIRSSIRISHFQ